MSKLMRFIADEMIEDLAPMLRKERIDCRTVHEIIDGSSVKTRKISDEEIREFMLEHKMKDTPFTLVTRDRKSANLARDLDLDVIYVQDVLREYILKKVNSS